MLVINPENNLIEFQLKLENATLQETSARMLIEVEDSTTVVPLEISDGGWVVGELPLNEAWDSKKGIISLEVIAKNTFFKPFTREVMFEGLEVLKPAILEVNIDIEDKPTPKRIIDVTKRKKHAAIKQPVVMEQAKAQTKLPSKKPVARQAANLSSEIRDFFKTK